MHIMLIITTVTVICIYIFATTFLKLNNNTSTLKVFKARKFSVGPYMGLIARIFRRKDRKITRMNETSKMRYWREFKRRRDNESMPKKTQRRQRESLRAEAYQPVDTGSINSDIITLVLKLFFIFFATIAANYYGVHYMLENWLYVNCVLVFAFYSILNISVTRQVLRETRFYWWRPWPLLLPVYMKGVTEVKSYKVFYIFLLPVPVWYVLTWMVYYFANERSKLSFIRYYWERLWWPALKILFLIKYHHDIVMFELKLIKIWDTTMSAIAKFFKFIYYGIKVSYNRIKYGILNKITVYIRRLKKKFKRIKKKYF